LPQHRRAGKARTISELGVPMSGIYMILVFVAVMAALNKFEFGRFD
jgi:ribose/xylose/arabinose/galactoside ABC-type transport system permease subunit